MRRSGLSLLIPVLWLACGGGGGDGGPTEPCNGAVHLCDRRLDEYAMVRTNNGHAALDDGFLAAVANHQYGLRRQLADGVRAPGMDVYWHADTLKLCHGACELGELDFATAMGWIADFLAANPREVLVLDVQNEAPVEQIVAGFEVAGLAALAHAQAPGSPWPTLGALLDAGTPLVILSTNAAGGPAWLNPIEDFVFGTPWGVGTAADLDCALETPAITHGLFKLNESIGNPTATVEKATEVNSDPFLADRLAECAAAVGHPVNLLSVDFYSVGDVLAAVDALNGVE